ncbi:MAG: hypothetical protein WCI00_03490 [bacterium]
MRGNLSQEELKELTSKDNRIIDPEDENNAEYEEFFELLDKDKKDFIEREKRVQH